MCISIWTPKNNTFSIVPNGKLIILGVPNFEQIQPNYNWLYYWGTQKPLIFHMGQMENQWF